MIQPSQVIIKEMVATIAKKEDNIIVQTNNSIIGARSGENVYKRAQAYQERIHSIINDFDERVGTAKLLEELFGRQAVVARFEGTIKPRNTRRGNHLVLSDNIHLDGYMVGDLSWNVPTPHLPKGGIFVGFLQREESSLPLREECTQHARVPQHWGVITFNNLHNRPYAMRSRLSGCQLPNRFGAQSLLLHENLDPTRAGWEMACDQLQRHLLHPDTIIEAQKVIQKGKTKQPHETRY